MELGTLNQMDETLYRAVMMLIQAVTLTLGLASLLFLLLSVVCVACCCFQEMARHARGQVKPVAVPEAQDLMAEPAGLDDGLDRLTSSVICRESASIQRA